MPIREYANPADQALVERAAALFDPTSEPFANMTVDQLRDWLHEHAEHGEPDEIAMCEQHYMARLTPDELARRGRAQRTLVALISEQRPTTFADARALASKADQVARSA